MKVAVIGSRNLTITDLGKYLPENTDEIVSGGANGIDKCARDYATSKGINLTEFLPDYKRYGRYAAPLKRNLKIIEYSDVIIAFWDSKSKGTKFVIENSEKSGKEITVYVIKP